MKGILVTCKDLETGEEDSKVIENDWLVITDGDRYLDGVQVFGNGTAVITIKRGAPDA